MDQDIPIYKFALREDIKDDLQFLPTRADDQCTGYDVRAAMHDKKPLIIKPGEYAKIPLGFRAWCPEGWWYKLVPRSSSFMKKHLHFLYGVIDETFPLEAVAVFQYIPEIKLKTTSNIYKSSGGVAINMCKSNTIYDAPDLTIKFGDAIAQIIPVKRQEMIVKNTDNNELDALYTKRNAKRIGGFGSSGV